MRVNRYDIDRPSSGYRDRKRQERRPVGVGAGIV